MCSSAMVFTTGLTFIILGILAKIVSAYLAGIAIFRLHNYLKSKQENAETKNPSTFLEFIDSKHNYSEKPTSAENLIEEFSQ